jgi:hypothetical protein
MTPGDPGGQAGQEILDAARESEQNDPRRSGRSSWPGNPGRSPRKCNKITPGDPGGQAGQEILDAARESAIK